MKKIVVLTFSIIFIAFSSCNDDVLDKNNPNQLSTNTFYESGDQIVAATNAVYAALQANNMYNREYFFLQDLLSDDCQSGGAQLEAPRAQVLNHVFDGSNPLVEAVWRGLYRVIARANQVIENVPNAPETVEESVKTRAIAEAKFLRAWAYFDLVSLWGRVPLSTSVVTSAEGIARSESTDMVYTLIHEDLEAAAAALPEQYATTDAGRATKWAAKSLEARVHLFLGEYQAARELLAEVISSGQFSLVDRYLDNFQEENENNAESIFEVQFSTAFGDGGAWSADGEGIAEITFRGQEYGPNAWRNVIPSDGLAAEFEKVENGATKDDPRYRYSFYFIGDPYNNGADTLTNADVQGDINVPSWKKYQMIYKRANENSSSGINFRVIRYADVLLMMAECENELTGPTTALPYINQVRARADVAMPPYPTAQYPCANQAQMFDAIVHERRVEMGGEQIRNRDIRRWRNLGKLVTEPIPQFESRYNLLPIPIVEIDNNSALTNQDQNPGY